MPHSWPNMPVELTAYSARFLGCCHIFSCGTQLTAGVMRHGWKARYVKEVDADENTLRFWQEIYDEQGTLVEIHEKYPADKGHRRIRED